MLPAYAGMIRVVHEGAAVVAVLPAYAGMIPCPRQQREPPERAPRVCGDDPVCDPDHPRVGECSPRMRG